MDSYYLTLLIFAAAILYSSVGHGGASAYLAAMALFSVEPMVMRPTALVLNVFVAGISTFRFFRAGHFSWPLLWPFVVASFPASFLGGAIQLPGGVFKPLVGFVLLFAAIRLVVFLSGPIDATVHPPRRGAALVWGCAIGLLSGLTGTGGGIFLSPLLLFMKWANTRQTAAVSAAFVLLNSVAGLLGNLRGFHHLPPAVAYWIPAAVVGSLLGAFWGSRRLPSKALRALLAVVLVIAGMKLIFS